MTALHYSTVSHVLVLIPYHEYMNAGCCIGGSPTTENSWPVTPVGRSIAGVLREICRPALAGVKRTFSSLYEGARNEVFHKHTSKGKMGFWNPRRRCRWEL